MRKRLIVARFARLLFENRRVSLRVRASLYPVLLLREEQIAAPAERRRRRRRRSRRRAMITAATAKIIILRDDGSMHHRRRRQRGSSIARSSRPLYRLSEHFLLCRWCVVGSSKRFFDVFEKKNAKCEVFLAPFLRHKHKTLLMVYITRTV